MGDSPALPRGDFLNTDFLNTDFTGTVISRQAPAGRSASDLCVAKFPVFLNLFAGKFFVCPHSAACGEKKAGVLMLRCLRRDFSYFRGIIFRGCDYPFGFSAFSSTIAPGGALARIGTKMVALVFLSPIPALHGPSQI
ncbi:MAG: hypothetical protein IIC13_10225 [SAR324 cluster bacterium]|nr:hypothetical protein [SAR324 cluster bacterium]MCH8886955.1 hypothetical protein [SAR324 cluster bacterium]